MRLPHISLFLVFLLPLQVWGIEADQDDLEWILQRHAQAVGGRAALEQIASLRMNGTITLANGNSIELSILKKRPNQVRVVQTFQNRRQIDASNGELAWRAFSEGNTTRFSWLNDREKQNLRHMAPMESPLLDPAGCGAVLERGEDLVIARIPLYRIIVTRPDNSRQEYFLNQNTFLESRVCNYDLNGQLIEELRPGKFTTVNGVTFPLIQTHLRDGEVISTVRIDTIDLNIGLMGTVFNPPAALQEN